MLPGYCVFEQSSGVVAEGFKPYELSSKQNALFNEVYLCLRGKLDEHVINRQRYLLQSLLRNPSAQNA